MMRFWVETMAYRKTIWTFFFILGIFIASCAHQAILYKEGVTVAVWDLDNVSPYGSNVPDLGEPLSAKVIETLKEKGRYSLVERERLLLALEELRLGTEPLVDENTRLELGRIAGARLMVFGGYQIIGNTIRVDLRLVEVETGRILKAVKKIRPAADFSGWLNAVEEAAKKL